MEVLAVSLGCRALHDLHGKQTLTSIVRQPCQFITLTTAGIFGDKHVKHDATVHIYFEHIYEYWTKKLGIVRKRWKYCHLGEDITLRCLQGLAEENFHLGDVWKVANDVRLQVYGARVPCDHFSRHCSQPMSWLRELAATGRCGIYSYILHGGTIEPGDLAGEQKWT